MRTFLFFCCCATIYAGDLEEVLKKNLHAHGDSNKLETYEGFVYSGKYIGEGMEIPFTASTKKSGKLRLEYSLNGITIIQSFDGKAGWQINPMYGSAQPQRMNEQEVCSLQEGAPDFMSLAAWRRKGLLLKLAPEKSKTQIVVKGVNAKDGQVMFFYINPDSYLISKREMVLKGSQASKKRIVTIVYPEYTVVSGLTFPRVIITKKADGSTSSKVLFEKIELHNQLPDHLFNLKMKVLLSSND